MITTGAISISNMMMVNDSLEELNMRGNSIGDVGISAIASKLGNCKVDVLNVSECNITLTGAESLATAISSHHTISELWLECNHITEEGAQRIVEAAVHNPVNLLIVIDEKYKNDKVKEMFSVLANKR